MPMSIEAPGSRAKSVTAPDKYAPALQASQPNGIANAVLAKPTSAAPPFPTMRNGSTGSVSTDTGIPSVDTRSKWNAINGTVVIVAASDSPSISVIPASGARSRDRRPISRSIGGLSPSPKVSENAAMPAIAAKLS